jgi:hypothetical protein
MAIQANQPKRVGWPCPVRSTHKRTPEQDFNSFFIMFYYIISTTYHDHISMPHIKKLETYFTLFLEFRTVWLVYLGLYWSRWWVTNRAQFKNSSHFTFTLFKRKNGGACCSTSWKTALSFVSIIEVCQSQPFVCGYKQFTKGGRHNNTRIYYQI